MVKDLMELDRYPWSGHSAIMGLNKNDWQARPPRLSLAMPGGR